MTETLTKQERVQIQDWAQEIWDEGLAEPAMMARALELIRYEETVCELEEQRGAFQDSQKLQA